MPTILLARHQAWATMSRWWRRARPPVNRLLIFFLALIILYGIWPYATLWRLHRALNQGDRETLELLVDLDAIRDEFALRLNKERVSAIDGLSDGFIEWLESGIRHHDVKALDTLVTLDWVQEQLIARSSTSNDFLPTLDVGFFEGPRDFRARIGQRHAEPVIMRLHLDLRGWRVSMFYY